MQIYLLNVNFGLHVFLNSSFVLTYDTNIKLVIEDEFNFTEKDILPIT